MPKSNKWKDWFDWTKFLISYSDHKKFTINKNEHYSISWEKMLQKTNVLVYNVTNNNLRKMSV